MALSVSVSPVKLLIFSLMIHVHISLNLHVHAEVDEATLKLTSDTLEWPLSMSSLFEDPFDENEEDELELGDNDEDQFGRRSLFWQRTKYYISYGALSANRIPCPPRSGRSYYTHNCYKARGPVHPYTRGCSMITRCRR